MSKTSITVALDWTPNTNHSGFYLALSQGLYEAAGLTVTLRSPDDPASQNLTPGKQVATGLADFGVGPSESVISFATSSSSPSPSPPLVAVASLCQGSISSICCLKSSGIARPKDLAGKSYASYCGRFEDAIVRKLVETDGGDGSKVTFKPLVGHGYDEDDTMEAGSVVASHLEKGGADSTWIFPHWEGVLADRAGQALTHFNLQDYDIPYGYSPILMAPAALAESAATAKFLAATAEGYKIAARDPAAAADALCESGHPSLSDKPFVLASAESIKGCFLDGEGKWGRMDGGRWKAFVGFLREAGILVDAEGKEIPRGKVDEGAELFTNGGLPE